MRLCTYIGRVDEDGDFGGDIDVYGGGQEEVVGEGQVVGFGLLVGGFVALWVEVLVAFVGVGAELGFVDVCEDEVLVRPRGRGDVGSNGYRSSRVSYFEVGVLDDKRDDACFVL